LIIRISTWRDYDFRDFDRIPFKMPSTKCKPSTLICQYSKIEEENDYTVVIIHSISFNLTKIDLIQCGHHQDACTNIISHKLEDLHECFTPKIAEHSYLLHITAILGHSHFSSKFQDKTRIPGYAITLIWSNPFDLFNPTLNYWMHLQRMKTIIEINLILNPITGYDHV